MKRTRTMLAGAALLALTLGAALTFLSPNGAYALGRDQDDDIYRSRPADVGDPDLKKKLVPIITVGSSLNIGVAQVQGKDSDVSRCVAVAQLETDYKDVARIKILVPVQSKNIVRHIDRVPGVSVSALADYAIRR